MASEKPWVVIKYGGTSVSSVGTWETILARVEALLPTNRVWIVVSAVSKVRRPACPPLAPAPTTPPAAHQSHPFFFSPLSPFSPARQVTNALLACLDEATRPGLSEEGRWASFGWVSRTHAALGAAMGLPPAAYAPTAAGLEDLRRLLEGIFLTGETSPRLRARVAAMGELLCSQLGLAFLRARASCAVTRVDARALLTSHVPEGATVADADRYLEADVRPTSPQRDRADAAAGGAPCVITQGFIANTSEGATCLLGRGGSDTSAALFAALVGAARLEIWTDVNGMFTADPRFVARARLIRALTYREAQELAACGARVLHPRCLLPAAFCGVPVQVRNTMDAGDDAEITTVSNGAAAAAAADRKSVV